MGPLKYQMPISFIDFRPYERSTIYHAIDAARSNHAGTSNRCVTLDVRVMVFDKAIRHLGSTIGMRPLTFFIASAVLFFVSISYLLLLPLKIHLGFDSGYTTTDAPSIRELQTQIDYFGNKFGDNFIKGKPWYMALFAEPREQTEGSMTDFKEFNEFERFYKVKLCGGKWSAIVRNKYWKRWKRVMRRMFLP
uniref:Patched family protein n=1 Tax=Angiostrongylus cantonensis TaxID=6313 RepID=A0A0K0CY53_ANGCA